MPEDWVIHFTAGSDFHWDTILLPFDIDATAAHVKGLVRAGIMTGEEADTIEASLDSLKEEWHEGRVEVTVRDEDGHTVIERWLTENVGSAGKKVHTARSRNDQVLAALRLWLRHQLDDLSDGVLSLANHLVSLAESEAETFLPGYTHLQRAMPSSVGLWAAGFAETLVDDLDFLREARRHVNVSPLGSGAGYGVPHVRLDRTYVAELLGFERIQENVTSVQLSRGKLELGAVHALLQTASTINRLAADLVLYASSEFGFVRFEDAHTTGSSIMPQKKNPDVAELCRAGVHRIAAEAHVLMTVPANLPSGYHRDLQLTKEAVMRAVLAGADLVNAANHLVSGVSFDRARLEAFREPELFATAAAMARVAAGASFRDAYRAVAARPEEWEKSAADTAAGSYFYDGTPGRPALEAIRKRMERYR
jgi:argininosuccinate lyase